MNGFPFSGPSRLKSGFFLLNALWGLVFSPPGLFAAAPLEGVYAQAVRDSASPEQKAEAARETRFRVINAAGKYEGVPYRYGGIDPGGLDCSGLVYLSFRDALSVSVPRTTTGLYAWVEKIPPDEDVQPGDLVFFKTNNTGAVSHVGIYTGDGRFIHAASEGPATGVMYSALNEAYWRRTYTGAGRVLPKGSGFFEPKPALETGSAAAPDSRGLPQPAVKHDGLPQVRPAPAKEEKGGHLLLGVALAPSWNGFLEDGNIIRGGAAQIRLGAETSSWKHPMLFGLELRPEWDGALGVFRMPITLSWGFDDKFRIFAGPAFSVGDAVLKTSGGDRRYTGGNSWIGAVGISGAPFSMKVAGGDLSFYGEFAWQSYFSEEGAERNWNADFAAGLRFSTGLRYTWRL
ncbi:MAG: C40 family peptidase [Treponema sp.]|jgi:probable lipoprotein NlpC|nr:C40 family peptidase [Treponema sp.]